MSTLALNMIVGPGEADVLKTCLESIPERMFAEKIIVNTGADAEVDRVAESFGAKVVPFVWKTDEYPFGNFGGARNAALDCTTAEWFMWLDADDILEFGEDKGRKIENLEKLCDKARDGGREVAFIRYVLTKEQDVPMISVYRERIIRNNKRFRWQHPVHELCIGDWDTVQHAKINGIDVVHYPTKPAFSSALRNAQILEHEYYKKGRRDAHTRYFLARDYMIIGKIDEAIPIYEDMIRDFQGTDENRYYVCLNAACWYEYGGFDIRPRIEDVKLENAKQIEGWLRCAITFCQGMAEPYVMLGDLYMRLGKESEAIEMYLEALTKRINHGGLQSVSYYEELPAQRLAWIYAKRNEFEKALWYNKRSIIHYPSNEMLELRRRLLASLTQEFEKNCREAA